MLERMIELEVSTAIWPLAALQFAGLLSAGMTRFYEGSRRASSCRWCFFVCLSLVGLATMMAMSVSPSLCLFSGTVLAVMVLMATWDVGLAGRTSAAER